MKRSEELVHVTAVWLKVLMVRADVCLVPERHLQEMDADIVAVE